MSAKPIKSPIKAIKQFCQECLGVTRTAEQVRNCPAEDCPLYQFRMGKNPYRKPISEEKREEMRQRALKMGFGRDSFTGNDDKSSAERPQNGKTRAG